jgi:hypothetical protein
MVKGGWRCGIGGSQISIFEARLLFLQIQSLVQGIKCLLLCLFLSPFSLKDLSSNFSQIFLRFFKNDSSEHSNSWWASITSIRHVSVIGQVYEEAQEQMHYHEVDYVWPDLGWFWLTYCVDRNDLRTSNEVLKTTMNKISPLLYWKNNLLQM